MQDVQIVILAAGHGKRMNHAELPKVLVPLKNKPLIKYLLDEIKGSGVCEKPTIVIGQKAQEVKDSLGDSYSYVLQEEQLGTGHAVQVTRGVLENKAKNIIVLYGDHPTMSAKTIQKIAKTHQGSDTVLTMATFEVEDFKDWRDGFYNFGRVIRNEDGQVHEIVEFKDASDEQKAMKELNPSYFCFKAEWLWENLEEIQNNNNQHEYYLTDLVGVACHQRQKISTVKIDPLEALGVNTPEQLERVEKLI